jgi:hypothetical protein
MKVITTARSPLADVAVDEYAVFLAGLERARTDRRRRSTAVRPSRG